MSLTASATAGQLALHKVAAASGITLVASVPTIFAVIEPFTYSDLQARFVYIALSVFAAVATFTLFQPKDWKDGAARLLMACLLSIAFTEPVAEKIRPYMTDITLKDGAPIVAALPASIFVGVIGWFIVAFSVWLVKSPRRIIRFWAWWKNKTQANFDSFLAEDSDMSSVNIVQLLANEKRPEKIAEILQYFGVAPDTKTKGGGQSQPTIPVTLTPSQKPTQEVKPSSPIDPGSKTKTIA